MGIEAPTLTSTGILKPQETDAAPKPERTTGQIFDEVMNLFKGWERAPIDVRSIDPDVFKFIQEHEAFFTGNPANKRLLNTIRNYNTNRALIEEHPNTPLGELAERIDKNTNWLVRHNVR